MIFLTSKQYSKAKGKKEFSEVFYKEHHIPVANTINLTKIKENNLGDPVEVLKEFQKEIKNGSKEVGPILIHCMQGLNRTPVAALIYLLEKGANINEALNIVNTALEKRVFPDGKVETVNARDNYTQVLEVLSPGCSSVFNNKTDKQKRLDERNKNKLGSSPTTAPTEKTQPSVTNASTSSSSTCFNLNEEQLSSRTEKPQPKEEIKKTSEEQATKKQWMPISKREEKELVKDANNFMKGDVLDRFGDLEQNSEKIRAIPSLFI